VNGEAYIGVDPFQYLDRHSRHHTAPGLIYDWIIRKIELNTAPYIKVNEGYIVRDPSIFSWREIEQTNAWKDGVRQTTYFTANCWAIHHAGDP
jgi:hypothetical protein